MTISPRETANRLLDGLVDYLLARLEPAQMQGFIEAELDFVLGKAAGYTLNDWVTPEQIQQTARKYASEMDISGAIPELVGDMVEEFYQQAMDSDRLVADVVDEDVIMALLDKVLEIPLSRQSMAWLGRNPVLLALLAGGAQMGIKTLLHQGMPAALRDQLSRRLPERWVNSLDTRMQDWLLRRTEQLLSDPWLYRDENLDELRELVLVGWQDFSQRPVAELRELLSSEDIQELFVIGFEYWRELRHTDYFNGLLDSGVKAFFDKYGEMGLVELLEELGVTRTLMLDDARRFAPPIIEKLRQEGLLEEWLRRHLGGFFEAEETLQLLSEQ
ncbi:hypothetical protein Y5S_03463 [Alcanivorax nanhaiticus]|uniref:Uncharacterized protein n=1 Tax=Alcanivorax nanhaiticus TaxID=1177154 RepID=A0A095TLI0_9GAMM|nr:hypothetical protein [Alcanivorax nanhaiticus]KGD63308.1 hypothetical protein Y5S_03463 [Alcanivorax nanhaiticus]